MQNLYFLSLSSVYAYHYPSGNYIRNIGSHSLIHGLFLRSPSIEWMKFIPVLVSICDPIFLDML